MAQHVDGRLFTIGQRLRAAREGRGWSVNDLARATHIRPVYLESLEAGERAALPADVFVQGFLRICGDALGMDGTALAEEWKRGRLPDTVNAHAATKPVRRRGRSSRRAVLIPWLILIGLVLLLALALLWAFGVLRL